MLHYKVESLDDIDDGVKALYEKNGDGYVLKVDGIPEPTDVSGLQKKVQELMDEAKSAKRKAREIEQAKALQDEETAKEKGEFKTLWEQAQRKMAEKDAELETFTTKIKQKDIDATAKSIGSQLAKTDAKRAEVLADYASKFARHTGETVQFIIGGMEVTADQLMNHLRKEYPFLVDGSSATGGGAIGSISGGAANKEITRSDFERLPPVKQMAFVKDGGIIKDA